MKEEPDEENAELSSPSEEQDWFITEGELAVDMYQADNQLVIQSAIAGIRPEELDVTVESDIVTIRGERINPYQEGQRQTAYQEECYWGPFSRQIILPEPVDIERAEASMRNGIFTLRLPITGEKAKVKKVKVKRV